MSQTEEFAKILKYGRCSSKVHGRCTNPARKNAQICPLPYHESNQAYHACTCCTTCYNHCKEEAKQGNEDFVESFREWASWKNRTKRNIEVKIRRIKRWCGST